MWVNGYGLYDIKSTLRWRLLCVREIKKMVVKQFLVMTIPCDFLLLLFVLSIYLFLSSRVMPMDKEKKTQDVSGKNSTLWGKPSQNYSFSRFKMRRTRHLYYRLPASIHTFNMLASRSPWHRDLLFLHQNLTINL